MIWIGTKQWCRNGITNPFIQCIYDDCDVERKKEPEVRRKIFVSWNVRWYFLQQFIQIWINEWKFFKTGQFGDSRHNWNWAFSQYINNAWESLPSVIRPCKALYTLYASSLRGEFLSRWFNKFVTRTDQRSAKLGVFGYSRIKSDVTYIDRKFTLL